MLDLAWAQTAQGASGPGGLLASFAPLVLIFVIFYFLLIRPQQKKAKEQREMLSKLKKNDEVVTSGGIHGKITGLTDTEVVLEVAPNVRVHVDRANISKVIRVTKVEKASVKEAKEQ